MKSNYLSMMALGVALLAIPAHAQETIAGVLADPALDMKLPADRAKAVQRIKAIENRRLEKARAIARQKGKPLREELPDGSVRELDGLDENGELRYVETKNANATISTGANLLHTSPYSLTGSGLTVGVWDAGSALVTHREFNDGTTSRVTNVNAQSTHYHSTHVAGTIAAFGVTPSAKGMAPGILIDSYDWTNDDSETAAAGAYAAGQFGTHVYLSNHSYGYTYGWVYSSTNSRWEWTGSGTDQNAYDADFGQYSDVSEAMDSIAFNSPYHLIFWSAGNERDDGPNNGNSVLIGGSTVAYNSSIHPQKDGTYRNGFETVADESASKNLVVVGAANDAVTDYQRDPSKATIALFSSTGPTDDGRIKPDLVANGVDLNSPLDSGDASYGSLSGTSMASPNACGSAALLVDMYRDLFGPNAAMRASTLKGLLIHTASDRGNPGPDYTYGWGLVDVKSAADLLQRQSVVEDQLSTVQPVQTYTFTWDGLSPIRATLSWTDPARTGQTDHDERLPDLVNNLNLKLIAPNGTEYFPYVMPFVGTWTVASMSLPATTGVNNVDNVEQVLVQTPAQAGAWQAVVSHSGALTNNQQNYGLIISGASITALAEALDETTLPWSTRADAAWFAQGDITHDGLDAAQSGDIGDGEYTVLETTTNSAGVLTFWWKVSSESPWDRLDFYLNDVEQPSAPGISGEIDWQQVSVNITSSGNHTLKWIYSKDSSIAEGSDAAWVDQVTFTPNYQPEIAVEQPAGSDLTDGTHTANFGTALLGSSVAKTFTIRNTGQLDLTGLAITKNGTAAAEFAVGALDTSTLAPGASTSFTVTFTPTSTGNRYAAIHIASNDADENPFDLTLYGAGTNIDLAQATDTPSLVWTTGGDASWFGQSSRTKDGVDAAQCNPIADNQSCYAETTVTGPATVSFWWKVSSEYYHDFLSLALDGVEQTGSLAKISGSVNWKQKSIDVPAGSHTLRWTYSKDDSYAYSDDTGWLDLVAVTYHPEIVVEQPAGTDLGTGATITCDPRDIGAAAPVNFTVRNTGAANLTSLALTKNGTHAGDFALGALGDTTVAPGANTTFTVTFTPSASGNRTATIQLASNVADVNPFAIHLTGYGRTPLESWRFAHFGSASNTGDGADTADADADGMPNLLEYAMNLSPAVDEPCPISTAETSTTMALIYPRNQAAADVSIAYEESNDMGVTDPWSPVTLTEEPVGPPAGGVQIIKATLVLTPGDVRKFLRLRIDSLP